MTIGKRAALLISSAAVALALSATPTMAEADSRRHVFKPGNDSPAGITRDSAPGANEAPEINQAALGLGLALAIGGLALLTGRRNMSAE